MGCRIKVTDMQQKFLKDLQLNFSRIYSTVDVYLSLSQGIVSLCLLFETLLQSQEPSLFYHLRQIGVHP